MKATTIVLALAVTACASPNETPEQAAVRQARAQALRDFAAAMQQNAPQAPLVIHCIGCR